jgi:hypothetical protein
MKRTTLQTAAITTVLASCFIFLTIHNVQAQSISGDDLCGASSTAKCTPAALKTLGTKVLSLFVLLGSVLLVLAIAVRVVMSWYAYRAGDAGAIKRAGQQAFNAFIGFIIVFAVFGGVFMILLNTLGAQPWVGKLLQMFSEAFVPHAYAVGTQLPNPLGSNSLYDILISAASLALRFFVYPAVIAMWVWSGFQFIYSQGNPDGLNKAKSWLFWAFIITVITFSLQGFLLAFRGTAEKIVPGMTNMNTSTTPTPVLSPTSTTTTAQPAPGTYGAACSIGTFNGIIGTDGTCQVGGSR